MRRGDKMKQYVIIGNGIAAAGCMEGIRSMDKESKITVISKENHPVYCRPLISYYLEGKTNLERMNYRSPNFYKDNGCEVLYGKSAAKIDPENEQVTLSDGTVLPYTSLCIATGSSPFTPWFEGIETVSNHFSFMTLDDTLALEQAISQDSRVLIIGAGLIGLKCAEGLHGRVGKITVCDLADKVLSSILDENTAPIVQKHLEANGIEFLMTNSVSRFAGNRAIMANGKNIDFDILVTAVGVRPNTSLMADIGGNVGRGIVVDESMQTSVPQIYAAGDCTEGFDRSLGANRVLALLPNAYMQGHAAGINMAGGTSSFNQAIPMNSIGFFGLHVMTAGSYLSEKDGGTVYQQISDTAAKKFFVRDGLLKGYILVGEVGRGGIYTSLIRNQTPLDTVDFDLLRENPTFLAFSTESRREKFGKAV